MLIDWFTVAAQIVNFLVLVYLLKRFLYGPIIRAMDERERTIASRLDEADKKREEAGREAQSYTQKNADFEAGREQMLTKAREEAEKQRKALIREVRSQVEALRANWYEALGREKESFLQDLRLRAAKHIYSAARQALKELADADLEDRMIQVFIERLEQMAEKEPEALRASIGNTEQIVEIRSAFEIPQRKSRAIVKALRERFGEGIEPKFESSPDGICGIEVRIHDRKIAWSLQDYLQSLEESLSEAFKVGKPVAGTKKALADGDSRTEGEKKNRKKQGAQGNEKK